jgi:hypothetical protein
MIKYCNIIMDLWCFGGIVFVLCFTILSFFGWLKFKRT